VWILFWWLDLIFFAATYTNCLPEFPGYQSNIMLHTYSTKIPEAIWLNFNISFFPNQNRVSIQKRRLYLIRLIFHGSLPRPKRFKRLEKILQITIINGMTLKFSNFHFIPMEDYN